jgi:hypothetical protein
LRLLRGEIEQDRVRLPEHEAIVFEHRHLPVGIHRDVLGRELIALSEIDDLRFAVEP